MYFRKINNASLWEKIKQLRESLKETKDFKKRVCFGCGKSLNIYDFLSDNLEFSAEYVLKLWQTSILEFHCCECFKYLKIHELKDIESKLSIRECECCKAPIDLYAYSDDNNYLKIHELKKEWLNQKKKIFCNNFCRKKYYFNITNHK